MRSNGVAGIMDCPPDEPVHGETPGGQEGAQEEKYVYLQDVTSSGPDQQWEILKVTRVDNYESQEDKSKRIHMEETIKKCEQRVEAEAKLGPRATSLSAWDAVLSDDESDAEDSDKDWLDELLNENLHELDSIPHPKSPEDVRISSIRGRTPEAEPSPNFPEGQFHQKMETEAKTLPAKPKSNQHELKVPNRLPRLRNGIAGEL